jgi:nitroreductase
VAGLTDAESNPALRLLLERRSHHRLSDPGPDAAQLDLILRAALRVPDFGHLRPYRFIAARGAGRERLGEAMQRAAAAAGRPPEVIARAPRMPLRAPLVLIAVSCPRPHETVSLLDQQLCAGCTLLTMQLAARALGYAGVWRSGWPVYDGYLDRELGLAESERVIGLLYLGTASADDPPKTRPADPWALLTWL